MIECRNGMENVTISPTMTTKLRSRDAANKIRHGSPKLQEVLREVSLHVSQEFCDTRESSAVILMRSQSRGS